MNETVTRSGHDWWPKESRKRWLYVLVALGVAIVIIGALWAFGGGVNDFSPFGESVDS